MTETERDSLSETTPERARARGVGLALSGGGFRAALFHVGVLARLAEAGLLQRVSAISCVSGGSIAGAAYYLTLLNELRAHGDGPLPAATYADCVRRTRAVVLEVSSANVRARVFRNPVKNLAMYLSPRYSRTDRAGDLIDRLLCRKLVQTGPRYGVLRKQVELRSLGHARAPLLIINATTMNTGHNWRFTTEGMGEQLGIEPDVDPLRDDIDKNVRLVWGSFDAIVEQQQDFPLGLAIAASACFPGLFRPLPVSGLYPGYRVDLMDGGAQDNQGVQALLDASASYERIVVSDGSGQLEDQRRASRNVASVVLRVVAMEGDRIREEQLIRLWERVAHAGDPSPILIHLRDGLLPPRVRPLPAPTPQPPSESELTGFGVQRRVQRLLARIRTDLDAFARLESLALIASGYLIARNRVQAPALGDVDESGWVPPELDTVLKSGPPRARRRLAAGAVTLGKPWAVWGATIPVYSLLVGALYAAAWYLYRSAPENGWRTLGLATAILGVPYALSRAVFRLLERFAPSLLRRRRVFWLLGGAMYAALALAIVGLAPVLLDWTEADWSVTEGRLVGLGVLLLPAFAPWLVVGLFFVEGWCWRRVACV